MYHRQPPHFHARVARYVDGGGVSGGDQSTTYMYQVSPPPIVISAPCPLLHMCAVNSDRSHGGGVCLLFSLWILRGC